LELGREPSELRLLQRERLEDLAKRSAERVGVLEERIEELLLGGRLAGWPLELLGRTSRSLLVLLGRIGRSLLVSLRLLVGGRSLLGLLLRLREEPRRLLELLLLPLTLLSLRGRSLGLGARLLLGRDLLLPGS
jgi:hypothetical protein